MTDSFKKHSTSLQSPATNAFPITPDDITLLPEVTRAVYIGGTGNITVTMLSDQEVTFSALPAGLVLPIRVKRIKNTGTTATALVGLV